MKKNILLILTFIISFILLIDNVEAAKELTCWYGQGVQQSALIVSQGSDGKRTFWSYAAGSSIQYAVKITYDVEENIKTAFTECPNCLDIPSSGKHNYDNSTTCKDGYVKLYNSYEKAWTYEDIKQRQFLNASELSEKDKESMEFCEYENHQGPVIFYIDKKSKPWKIYTTILSNDASFNPEKVNYYIFTFSKYTFENEYKTSYCPKRIYYRSNGDSYPNGGTTYVLFLDSSKAGKGASVLKRINQSELEEEEEEEPTVEINSCGDLFSNDLIKEINKVMNIIRIAVPILLIIFGIVDFFKATFDNNEDEMKKNRERFIKRIIAAIIVFLVPFFVNLVLDVANTVWSDINSDTCIDSTE